MTLIGAKLDAAAADCWLTPIPEVRVVPRKNVLIFAVQNLASIKDFLSLTKNWDEIFCPERE